MPEEDAALDRGVGEQLVEHVVEQRHRRERIPGYGRRDGHIRRSYAAPASDRARRRRRSAGARPGPRSPRSRSACSAARATARAARACWRATPPRPSRSSRSPRRTRSSPRRSRRTTSPKSPAPRTTSASANDQRRRRRSAHRQAGPRLDDDEQRAVKRLWEDMRELPGQMYLHSELWLHCVAGSVPLDRWTIDDSIDLWCVVGPEVITEHQAKRVPDAIGSSRARTSTRCGSDLWLAARRSRRRTSSRRSPRGARWPTSTSSPTPSATGATSGWPST